MHRPIGLFANDDRARFSPLASALRYHDYYMITADFEAYYETQCRVDRLRQSPSAWARMSILNIANMGWFLRPDPSANTLVTFGMCQSSDPHSLLAGPYFRAAITCLRCHLPKGLGRKTHPAVGPTSCCSMLLSFQAGWFKLYVLNLRGERVPLAVKGIVLELCIARGVSRLSGALVRLERQDGSPP